MFALGPDERMTVVDTHGGQAAEVTVLDADGRDDAAALGAKADAPATVIREALADRNGSLLAHELGSRGLDPGRGDSRSGSSASGRPPARRRRSAPSAPSPSSSRRLPAGSSTARRRPPSSSSRCAA